MHQLSRSWNDIYIYIFSGIGIAICPVVKELCVIRDVDADIERQSLLDPLTGINGCASKAKRLLQIHRGVQCLIEKGMKQKKCLNELHSILEIRLLEKPYTAGQSSW